MFLCLHTNVLIGVYGKEEREREFSTNLFSLEKKEWEKRKETSILFQKKKKLARSYRVSPAVYIITVKLHDDDGSNVSSSVGLLFLSDLLLLLLMLLLLQEKLVREEQSMYMHVDAWDVTDDNDDNAK